MSDGIDRDDYNNRFEPWNPAPSPSTDERNLAGRFMVNKGVVMGGKPLPLADVQQWLTEYGAQRYETGRNTAPPPLDRGEFEREQLAKWFWDYEKRDCEAAHEKEWGSHHEFAEWPQDAPRQPYCQWAYRMADAFLVSLAAQHFRRQG